MGILNTEPEFCVESDATFHQLAKNCQAKEPAESTSICYLLKDRKFDEDVYKLSSKYLDESMPNYCEVEKIRKVVVECFYNGHWGCWKFSPILGEVASQSGFSQVERWLDNWSKTKDDYEYNKKYSLWLLKVTYPAQETNQTKQYGLLTGSEMFLAENSRSNRNKRKKRFFLGNEVDWERFLKEIQEITRHEINGKSEKTQKKKLYPLFAYGFTLGPYGRVYITHFGHSGCFTNIQNSLKTDQKLKPLVDILEEDDKIRIVAELPRANKEQINIIGTEKNLIINVNRQRQQPAMNLDLPCSVNPETAKATLKNGVLEIVLKKGRSLPFKIKRIDIK